MHAIMHEPFTPMNNALTCNDAAATSMPGGAFTSRGRWPFGVEVFSAFSSDDSECHPANKPAKWVFYAREYSWSAANV
jgi:hypothetical protein